MKTNYTYELIKWGNDVLPIRVHFNDRENRPVLFEPHWHKQIELVYVLDGAIKLTCDSRKIVGEKDELLIVNSNQVHYAQSLTERVCYYVLIIDYDIFRDYRGDIVQSKYINPIENNLVLFINKISNDQEINQSVNEIILEFENAAEGYEFAIKSATYKLLVQLIRNYKEKQLAYDEYAKTQQNLEELQEVFTYIEKNFANDISTVDLANLLNISTEHFCRKFKAFTGMTAITYINRIRINEACELLKNNELNILEVATKVGFSNSPYFCKVFKNYINMTPSEYRNQLLDNHVDKAATWQVLSNQRTLLRES